MCEIIFLSFSKTDIGIEQDSAFSPIPSAIYTVSIFHIFEKRSKILLSSISVLTLLFVDNSLLICQEKSYGKSNVNLFCSYSIISSLFNQFGLVIKHDKLEIFHFSKFTKNTQSPALDLCVFKVSSLEELTFIVASSSPTSLSTPPQTLHHSIHLISLLYIFLVAFPS